jgi:glycerol-3-phosphate O-acyltransferase/dihydroxyacetone phosphate acyltransferase
MHWPILYLSSVISKQKAAEALASSTVKLQGKDVMATWKVLVALVVTPVLYLSYYSMFFLYLYFFTSYSSRMRWFLTLFFASICPAFGFAAVKASETGMDIIKSLRPLFLAIFPSSTQQLRQMRAELTISINNLIADLGPRLYGVSKEQFEAIRIVKTDAAKYSEALLTTNKKVDTTFRWEEVDPEEVSDDVFLFRDDRSGATVGDRARYGGGSPTRETN